MTRTVSSVNKGDCNKTTLLQDYHTLVKIKTDYGLRNKGLVWLIEIVMCLHAAPRIAVSSAMHDATVR